MSRERVAKHMERTSTNTYTPESALRHPTTFLRRIAGDLRRSHALGWRLAVRDVNAQYRQTALGFLWALILPLGNAGAWLLMRGAGIVDAGDTDMPYALYVFIGTMCWSIFADALHAPVQQATAAKPLLAKVSFPPEALVISGGYQTVLAAAIKLALVLAAVLCSGIGASASMLLLPLGAAFLILAGTALGLLLTPIGLLYSDVAKSLPLMTQFLMYLSPVVYAVPREGAMAELMRLNPVTPLLSTMREWAIGGLGMPTDMFIVAAGSFVLVFVLWAVFKAAMPILVERIGS
jgi:lipopolysaccharide transport system permease protein